MEPCRVTLKSQNIFTSVKTQKLGSKFCLKLFFNYYSMVQGLQIQNMRITLSKFSLFRRSTIPLPRNLYALVSRIFKKSLHLNDGVSE